MDERCTGAVKKQSTEGFHKTVNVNSIFSGLLPLFASGEITYCGKCTGRCCKTNSLSYLFFFFWHSMMLQRDIRTYSKDCNSGTRNAMFCPRQLCHQSEVITHIGFAISSTEMRQFCHGIWCILT